MKEECASAIISPVDCGVKCAKKCFVSVVFVGNEVRTHRG